MSQDLSDRPPPSPTPRIDWKTEETRKKLDANVDAWIASMKNKLSELEAQEMSAPKKYAVPSVRKKHGVEPELYGDKGNNQYNWTMEGLNKLTVEEYSALWKAGLTVAAYVRANGYCFTYAVGKALKEEYKTVRSKVKESMETLLKQGRDRFRGWCNTFLNERPAKNFFGSPIRPTSKKALMRMMRASLHAY